MAYAAFSGVGAGGASSSSSAAAASFDGDGFMSVGGGGSGMEGLLGSAPMAAASSSSASASSAAASAPSGVGVSGRMSSSAPAAGRGYAPVSSYAEDSSNDGPLLRELGVDFAHIGGKVAAVLSPRRAVPPDILADSDVAGPLLFCVALGVLLLLAGKVHFGYIYGFGGVGVGAMHALLSLMAPPGAALDAARTFSVLGYCLLPVAPLAALAVVLDMRGALGAALGGVAIAWSAWSATRFFEAACGMRPQRWLLFFPALLLYSVFVLITIF